MKYKEMKNQAMNTKKDTEYLLDILGQMLQEERFNKSVRQVYARKLINYFMEE